MSFTYRYTGDQRTVFISLEKDGETFAPIKGDTITTNDAIGHPLLELVVTEKPEGATVTPTAAIEDDTTEEGDPPVTPYMT